MRTKKPKNNRIGRKNVPSQEIAPPTDEETMYEEIWLEKIFGKLQIKDLLANEEVFRISKRD